MRAVMLSMVFFPWAAACGPKVSPHGSAFDEDLPKQAAAPAAAPEVAPAIVRPVALPGKGMRTGTIARDRLVAVLNAGPGTFLRQMELAPKLSGERFVGWELVQLVDKMSPLFDLDILPGDVLLAVNGKPISRPDQLQSVWDSLRTANAVSAQVWRGNAQLTLEFAIEPKL
ncbi:MAG: PDZ domain-containing protein [Kofleriaceae bacterium]